MAQVVSHRPRQASHRQLHRVVASRSRGKIAAQFFNNINHSGSPESFNAAFSRTERTSLGTALCSVIPATPGVCCNVDEKWLSGIDLEIPLHTNGAEPDIQLYVTKRKISGGTQVIPDRDCRAVFLSLVCTATKLGFSFWTILISPQSLPTRFDQNSRADCLGQNALGFPLLRRVAATYCKTALFPVPGAPLPVFASAASR
ncbi:MAG: hypothetical protein ACYCZB_16510 [Acidiphilium sp.]